MGRHKSSIIVVIIIFIVIIIILLPVLCIIRSFNFELPSQRPEMTVATRFVHPTRFVTRVTNRVQSDILLFRHDLSPGCPRHNSCRPYPNPVSIEVLSTCITTREPAQMQTVAIGLWSHLEVGVGCVGGFSIPQT